MKPSTHSQYILCAFVRFFWTHCKNRPFFKSPKTVHHPNTKTLASKAYAIIEEIRLSSKINKNRIWSTVRLKNEESNKTRLYGNSLSTHSTRDHRFLCARRDFSVVVEHHHAAGLQPPIYHLLAGVQDSSYCWVFVWRGLKLSELQFWDVGKIQLNELLRGLGLTIWRSLYTSTCEQGVGGNPLPQRESKIEPWREPFTSTWTDVPGSGCHHFNVLKK